MIRDPIVEEVRAIREELAAKFDCDIREIVADAQRRQAASQSRIFSFQEPNRTHGLQTLGNNSHIRQFEAHSQTPE
jgi:hypothetical protein